MEAPEKLYFGVTDKSVLDIYSTKESNNEVEYIRTDAFIEKAEKWFKSHGSFTIGFDGATFGDFLNFINK